MNDKKTIRRQKAVTIATAQQIRNVFWPDFFEADGCVFAAFQKNDDGHVPEGVDGKTGVECFINHTHIFDEFKNRATTQTLEPFSEHLDLLEESYDDTHPDFIAACELGVTMARMWATKLKMDYPQDRFRVYYTQYDNPIVRFHKVRADEPVWLEDDALRSSTDAGFRGALIYDTAHLEAPITNGACM